MLMRHFLMALLILTTSICARSQTFPGYRTGNYTGVNGVFFNPANIADNRFKLDVNLVAINGFIGNDEAALDIKDITRSFNADSLKSKLLRGNEKVNSFQYADVLGPSVMAQITKNTTV